MPHRMVSRSIPRSAPCDGGGFRLDALADDERERRFAAVDAASAPIIARFSPEGSLAAPSIISVATARRGS